MKIPTDSAALSRSLWKWCGALLGVALALGGVSLAISSGAVARFTLFPRSEVLSELPSPNPNSPAKRDRSLSKALAKLDANTVRAYFERYSNPEKTTASGPRPAVYIDAETLAHRHPAWQLAQKLESGAISPSNPQIARVLRPLQAGNSLAAPPAGAVSAAPLDSAPRDVPGVVLSESGSSQAAAASHAAVALQTAALNRFLRQNAARDAARARDAALLSRAALEDETARAARVVLELEVPLLPPDVALELLNLRLELLSNLSRTPVQRAAARARIRVIEARYAESLKALNQAQSARLRAATIEAPERARREGLLQIERERQATSLAAAATRREITRQAQARLDRDGASTALRLQLPPFRPLQLNKFRSATSAARQNEAAAQVFETADAGAASKARLEVEGPRLRARQQLIGQLRRQARLEGALWARESAAALGATWSRDAKSPDATARALNLVFPQRLR